MLDNPRARVVIRGVEPEIECGRFAIKRTVGEDVVVEADIFADGHDAIGCILRNREETDVAWEEIPMLPLGNDRWRASFTVSRMGRYVYSVLAWADPFRTWYGDLQKRIAAGQDISLDMRIGAELLESAAARAAGDDAQLLRDAAAALPSKKSIDAMTAALAERYPDRSNATISKEMHVTVDRERARFSTWYELFPRSTADAPGKHGTFRDCERWIPQLASMGFDIVYFPPIHPIGRKHRKGRNNSPVSGPEDPGSPWAIGAIEGGHKAIHPELGTLDDFRHLVQVAAAHGMEIALDLAYQCAPDHPYVQEHPEWFRWRPDGTVQYAENPPKKYEDIYPFEFDSPHAPALWTELKSVIEFWIDQGVRVFRVDNPHTKPFAMWEWIIGGLKKKHPDLIFLSEAFTRPNLMYWLAKLGFTQSYTYFTWRTTRKDLTDYLTELTQSEVRDYFRPNFWPNTPDILHEYLQTGGRPAFIVRLVLAATLSSNYGIYGPAFEHMENTPREQGSEEYLNSEKYEVKYRDMNVAGTLRSFITRVNAARHQNPALQSNHRLQFHTINNDQLLCYSKRTANWENVVITVVNLDPFHTQAGFVDLPLHELRIDARHPYIVTDLLTGARYAWQGPRNYVELRPHDTPAHIFRVGG